MGSDQIFRLAEDIVYEGSEPYIFISYAHVDAATVLPIVKGLHDRGFRIWYDTGIGVGTEWNKCIGEHVLGCSVFVSMMSDHAAASSFCLDEISYAAQLGKPSVMAFLHDNVRMDAGIHMRSNRFQNVFFTRHPSVESFVEEFAKAEIFQCCREKKIVPTPNKANGYAGAMEQFKKQRELLRRQEEAEKQAKLNAPALALFGSAAEGGNADAQYKLGLCYLRGVSADLDIDEGIRWLTKAATLGHAEAQSNLGSIYYLGELVPQDPQLAVKWLVLALANEDTEAMYTMALCYKNGFGVAKNEKTAIQYLRKAAARGHTAAGQALTERWVYLAEL